MPAPSQGGGRKKSSVPDIDWKANNGALLWQLIGELEKPENFRVLFGKKNKNENTSGDRKVTVYKRVAQAILPEGFAAHPNVYPERIKSKIASLTKTYKEHVKRLRRTGAGIEDENAPDADIFMEFYIPPDGPNETTTAVARNIWDEIMAEFPLFARLHAIFATRPNVTPPAVITGVGPHGRQTIHYQPLSNEANIDPQLRGHVPPARPVAPAAPVPAPVPTPATAAVLAPAPAAPAAPVPAAIPVPAAPTAIHELAPAHAVAPSSLSLPSGPVPAPAPAAVPMPIPVPVPAVVPGGMEGQRRAPRPSSNSQQLLTEVQAAVKAIPRKRGFEEMLTDVLAENMQFMKEQKLEERRLKERELLLRELEAGGYTLPEYRAMLAKVNGAKSNDDASGNLAGAGPSRVRARADSPTWDIENGVNLSDVVNEDDPVLEEVPRDD